MDQDSRAQIRLILEYENAGTKRAVGDRLQAIYRDHAAKGLLQSGATVKVALAAMEELASENIKRVVDQVAAVAKDIEAFAMIREAVDALLRFLEAQVEDVAGKATGSSRENPVYSRTFHAVDSEFSKRRDQLNRQLEIHRLTFTVPFKRQEQAPAPIVEPVRRGKPLAAHWDEMWATISIMLYTGDLQPKTQAEIERAMKDWLSARNFDVGDTAVRNRARQLWKKLQQSE